MEKIMNKIGKKAVDTYRAASKGAEKIGKEIKLKTQMSNNKAKIQELYEDIGKTVYEKYILDEEINVDRDLLNNCSMIDILADEVEDMRMELLKLKDMKQCPKCHYEIYYDFHFCPNCGNVQELSEDEKKNDGDATILTTDDEDKELKQHIDAFPIDDEEETEQNNMDDVKIEDE